MCSSSQSLTCPLARCTGVALPPPGHTSSRSPQGSYDPEDHVEARTQPVRTHLDPPAGQRPLTTPESLPESLRACSEHHAGSGALIFPRATPPLSSTRTHPTQATARLPSGYAEDSHMGTICRCSVTQSCPTL